MTSAGDIIDQAIAWHLRQDELTAADWHAFVAWLEAAPAHARAYDRIAAQDRLLAGVRATVPAAAPVRPSAAASRRRWAWVGAATAIAASLALLLPGVLPKRGGEVALTTAPGVRRTVQLADGTRIEMSGGTTIRLRQGDTRLARLDAGEATFHVVHDARAPFVVQSGALSIQDLGTVFDVTRQPRRLDVAVAEGSVLFQPGRDAVTLSAGQALAVDEEKRTIAVTRIAPATVGSWRSGELVFSGQSVGAVFETIHRLTGSQVAVAPDLSVRPFTGMVRVSGVADQDIPHIAALIGASWRRDGERWILSPAAEGAR